MKWRRWLYFSDSAGQENRAIQLWTWTNLREKGRMTWKVIQKSSGLPPWIQMARQWPWFQQARWPPPEALGAGPHCKAMGAASQGPEEGTELVMAAKLLPQWVQKTGHWAKEDYAPDLGSNAVCLARFGTCLGPIMSSSLWFLPFEMGMYTVSLSYCILEHGIWFHRFTAREEFLPHPYLIWMISRWEFGLRFDSGMN